MIVIADTTPLHYLIIIGHVNVLPELFGRIVIPAAVEHELRHTAAPEQVRAWMAYPPAWIEVCPAANQFLAGLEGLDSGEREAIALAEELKADALIIDERAGRRIARARQLVVIGTLGVLEQAGKRGLLDLEAALDALLLTTFRIDQALVHEMLLRSGGSPAHRRTERE